jgi:hypothetical protein
MLRDARGAHIGERRRFLASTTPCRLRFRSPQQRLGLPAALV